MHVASLRLCCDVSEVLKWAGLVMMFDGRGSFCQKLIMLPRPSFLLFTRRKLLCEAVWLAGYKTEEWQKEIPPEEPMG